MDKALLFFKQEWVGRCSVGLSSGLRSGRLESRVVRQPSHTCASEIPAMVTDSGRQLRDLVFVRSLR